MWSQKCFLGTLLGTLTAVIFCAVVFKNSLSYHDLVPIDASSYPYSNATLVTSTQTTYSVNHEVTKQTQPLCPKVPPNIDIPLKLDFSNITLDALEGKYPSSTPWGRFQPEGCRSRVRLAVVIPYRDREEHLCMLLNNLIPFLNKQQADFNIYVTEQSPGGIFNKGILINAGVREALKTDNYTCIVIHDVDLIPETNDNYYRCQDNPVHLATANGKYGYMAALNTGPAGPGGDPGGPVFNAVLELRQSLLYPTYCGGSIAITPDQFRRINGFSNLFFGWGGEDDDFGIRVKTAGMRLIRNPYKQGRYYAIKHGLDRLNPENLNKGKLLRSSSSRMRTEGLSTLHCNQTVMANGTFTWIHVTIDEMFHDATIKIG